MQAKGTPAFPRLLKRLYNHRKHELFISGTSAKELAVNSIAWRWMTSLLLVIGGALLGFDVGNVNVMGLLSQFATRNPATIWLTTTLDEHAPYWLLRLEQDILHYYSLAPYVLLLGMVAGCCFRWRVALRGNLLVGSYAVCFSILLVKFFLKSEALSWYDSLENVFALLTLVPIYTLGVHINYAIRSYREFRFSIRDMLVISTLAGLLMFVALYRPYLGLQITLLLLFSWLAWRSCPKCSIQEEAGAPTLAG